MSQLSATEFPTMWPDWCSLIRITPMRSSSSKPMSRPSRSPGITGSPTPTQEGVDVYASFEEVQEAGPLPDVPLIVVTAGRFEGWPPGWDPHFLIGCAPNSRLTWPSRVPDGQQIIVRDSGHEVPQQQPELVVRAVEKVLAQT